MYITHPHTVFISLHYFTVYALLLLCAAVLHTDFFMKYTFYGVGYDIYGIHLHSLHTHDIVQHSLDHLNSLFFTIL